MRYTLFVTAACTALLASCDLKDYPDCGFEVAERRMSPTVRTSAGDIAVFLEPDGPDRAHDTVALIRHCRTPEALGPENDRAKQNARSLSSSLGGDAVTLEFALIQVPGEDASSYTIESSALGWVLRWR